MSNGSLAIKETQSYQQNEEREYFTPPTPYDLQSESTDVNNIFKLHNIAIILNLT